MLMSRLQVEPYCHPAPEYHQQWHVLVAEIAAWSNPENYPSCWTPVSSPSTPLFFSRPMTDEELAAEFGDPAADEEPTIASQILSLLLSTSAQSTDAVSSEHPSPRNPQDEGGVSFAEQSCYELEAHLERCVLSGVPDQTARTAASEEK